MKKKNKIEKESLREVMYEIERLRLLEIIRFYNITRDQLALTSCYSKHTINRYFLRTPSGINVKRVHLALEKAVCEILKVDKNTLYTLSTTYIL
jgi:hypothetical protein